MLGSAKVRAARKASQKARIKAKENAKGNEYAEWFAALPKQVAKAKIVDQIRIAKNELNDALDAILVAEETGEGLLAAQEDAHVASLLIGKLQDALKPPTSVSLTGAGAMT